MSKVNSLNVLYISVKPAPALPRGSPWENILLKRRSIAQTESCIPATPRFKRESPYSEPFLLLPFLNILISTLFWSVSLALSLARGPRFAQLAAEVQAVEMNLWTSLFPLYWHLHSPSPPHACSPASRHPSSSSFWRSTLTHSVRPRYILCCRF